MCIEITMANASLMRFKRTYIDLNEYAVYIPEYLDVLAIQKIIT